MERSRDAARVVGPCASCRLKLNPSANYDGCPGAGLLSRSCSAVRSTLLSAVTRLDVRKPEGDVRGSRSEARFES